MNDQTPPWSLTVKIIAFVLVFGTCLYFVNSARVLVIPILMSIMVAYLISPVVTHVQRWTKLPFLVVLIAVYVLLIATLIAVPARILPLLASQANYFIASIPGYVEQGIMIASEPILLPTGDIVVFADYVPLETVADRIIGFLPSLSAQSFNVFGSVASYTAWTVGWVAFVIFVSFYLIKDAQIFIDSIVNLVAEAYREEVYRLFEELNAVWHAFLRGQFTIALTMGTIVGLLSWIVGMPYPLLIGLIAALSEFLPQIGPATVLLPMSLIAFFQSESSWLGMMMTPLGFALASGLVYLFINQMANYFLYPRVMGTNLNMHPLVVFVGALAGFFAAGVLGVLLASPLIASGRVVIYYIYCKLQDIPPFPERPAIPPDQELVMAGSVASLLSAPREALKSMSISQIFSQIDRSVRLWMKKWMLKP